MSLLDKINQVGLLNGKTFIKARDMQIGRHYRVISLRNFDGEYGTETIVELEENLLSLPRRMKMSEENIKELSVKELSLVCRGMKHIEKYNVETPLLELVDGEGTMVTY